MKTKMKLLSALTLSFASCLIAGVAGVRAPVTAHGAKIGDVSVTSFEMQYGASLYKLADGIRFTAQIDADEYTALEYFDESRTDVAIGYGMLITTKKYASQYELNAQNVFGVGGTAQYTSGLGGTLPIVNQVFSEMGKSSTASPLDPYLLYGTITNTIPDNATPAQKQVWLQGEYVARAYIKYEVVGQNTQYIFADYASDITVDDSSKADYLNNTRSMFQVALNRINSNDADSVLLYETYVKPIVGTTYTVNKYIDTHSGHYISLNEQFMVTGNTAVSDILKSLQTEGYNGQKLEMVKDGSGNVTLNCYLQPNDVTIRSKYTSAVLNIPGSNVFYIDQKTDFNKATLGIYYNATATTWCLDSEGVGGQVAVINKNGELIFGRDGDNGKLVNSSNPIRVSSNATTLKLADGTTGNVSSNYARNISVPADHYVIVIPGGTAYTTDRAFMRSYVLNEYYNAVEVTLKGLSTPLTGYANDYDMFGNDEVFVNAGEFNEDELHERMLAGIRVYNDNSTFTTTDDVSGYTLTLTPPTGVDYCNTEGSYEFTITATKGYSKVVDDRTLTVISSATPRLYIKDRSDTTSKVWTIDWFEATGATNFNSTNDVANTQLTVLSQTYLTTGAGSSYTGSGLSSGVAFLTDKSGKILEIFDGANGKRFVFGTSRTLACTAGSYAKEAIDIFRTDVYKGGYIFIAPDNTDSREFLLDNRAVGRYVEYSKCLFSYK